MGIFIVIIIIIIFVKIIEAKDRVYVNMTSSWKTLARSNGLNLRTSSTGEAKMTGTYGKYKLQLYTYSKGWPDTDTRYTRLTLSAIPQTRNNRSKNIGLHKIKMATPADAIGLLTFANRPVTNIRGTVMIRTDGKAISYEQRGVENNVGYLQFLFDFLNDLADSYIAIVNMGGEIVPDLEKISESHSGLRPVIHQMLRHIAHKTTARLGHRAKNLLCPHCLTCYRAYKVPLNWPESITYYGCRTCHQSREFFEGWVVALLDNRTTQEQVQQNGVLRVNWLSRRALFDFDEVEIIQATDEAVERFAVQVGNDTDPLRKPRYRQMRCVVSAGCGLSENSYRILRRMFGSVELRPAIAAPDHITDENGLRNTEIHKEDTEIHAEVSSF